MVVPDVPYAFLEQVVSSLFLLLVAGAWSQGQRTQPAATSGTHAKSAFVVVKRPNQKPEVVRLPSNPPSKSSGGIAAAASGR